MKQNYATVTPCITVAVGAAGVWKIDGPDKKTRSSATADGPRDALCQSKSCKLQKQIVQQIQVMELAVYS